MLAGVGGIDLALLVVAADEGVMPQTREHLAIIDLLGIEHGVVALTKSDLVDARDAGRDRGGSPRGDRRDDARRRADRRLLGGDGRGLDDLVAAIEAQLALTPRATRRRAGRGCRSTARSRCRASGRW